MKPFPHQYTVKASAGAQSSVELTASGLTPFTSAPPAEFDGPGDMWSPETLFVAAVSDCFILTFRAVAKASKLMWTNITCEANGTVQREGGITRFTGIDLHVRVAVSDAAGADTARRVLEKTEKSCLVANSLKCVPALHADVSVEQAA